MLTLSEEQHLIHHFRICLFMSTINLNVRVRLQKEITVCLHDFIESKRRVDISTDIQYKVKLWYWQAQGWQGADVYTCISSPYPGLCCCSLVIITTLGDSKVFFHAFLYPTSTS